MSLLTIFCRLMLLYCVAWFHQVSNTTLTAKFVRISEDSRMACPNSDFDELLDSRVECLGTHTHSNGSFVLLELDDGEISCTSTISHPKNATNKECSLIYSRAQEAFNLSTSTRVEDISARAQPEPADMNKSDTDNHTARNEMKAFKIAAIKQQKLSLCNKRFFCITVC